MDSKKPLVDRDKEILVTASMAVKIIRDGAKSSGIEEIAILRVITKVLCSEYDVMHIRQ